VTNYGTDSIRIFLGYGNRTFSNVTTCSTGINSHPFSLAVADFNNDSLTDIVVANSETNNVVILIGYGNGSFFTLMTYSMGDDSQPMLITAGDFNKDFQLDIVRRRIMVRTMYVVFKDLNKDGREDIAVATYGIDNIKIR
jgi:hypothetical protein